MRTIAWWCRVILSYPNDVTADSHTLTFTRSMTSLNNSCETYSIMLREIMHREGPEPTEKYSPQFLSFVPSQNWLILTVIPFPQTGFTGWHGSWRAARRICQAPNSLRVIEFLFCSVFRLNQLLCTLQLLWLPLQCVWCSRCVDLYLQMYEMTRENNISSLQ